MSGDNKNSVFILRLKQVIERTGLSRSTIYRKADPKSKQHDPSFPKRVHLGGLAVGWVESEINHWLEERAKSSRAA